MNRTARDISRAVPALAALILCLSLAEAGTVSIKPSTRPPEATVTVGGWYRVDAVGGTFQATEAVTHLEVALYDPFESLIANGSPFLRSLSRSSGTWPDGPENEAGDLGHEVSPNVLGDSNSLLYGKPNFCSLRLFDGALSPEIVYAVEVECAGDPCCIWVHPLRRDAFTMSRQILQSSEPSLTNPIYGPASVVRTSGPKQSTRFAYTGLDPAAATGLKDDYPVQDYDQRPGSHGNGDFGWFPGYALGFENEGPDAVYVSLFMNTGFTGPSGAPTNTVANDTFWKSAEIELSAGDSGTAWLDFADAEAWSISDNPFPHTAGDQGVPNGTKGIAINIFDRLQVSAIGWEVRSATGAVADASLLLYPVTEAPYAMASGQIGVPGGRGDRPVARLLPASPNPFRAGTDIAFEIPGREPVPARLAVFDVEGRQVSLLVDRPLDPGPGSVSWDGRTSSGQTAAAGVYFLRLELAGQGAVSRRLVRIP